MEAIPVYDTPQQIESKITPDLLASVLFTFVPDSRLWICEPDEDDPSGSEWSPEWIQISEGVQVIERFLESAEAQKMKIDDFSAEELVSEVRLFLEELKTASRHTSQFYLCVY